MPLKLSKALEIRRKIELALPAYLTVVRQLYDHPNICDYYPRYLFMLHNIVVASVPLMQDASKRSKYLASKNDQVATSLISYFDKHISEEEHHDDWLLEDLQSIHCDNILKKLPSITVASLVGAQYYWINHYHPVSLLGYILVLEGYPPTTEQIQRLKDRTGYPVESFQTLIKHAQVDPFHRDELNFIIDSLPLTQHQEQAISLNALFTIDLCTKAIQEVLELEQFIEIS